MNKLIRTDFARLLKSKLFWGSVVFFVFLPLFICFTTKLDVDRYRYISYFEENVWSVAPFVSIAMSIVVSVFIGTDYADKTIRNKICIGHGKFNILVSNMIVSVVAAEFMLTVFNIFYFAVGLCLFPIRTDAFYIAVTTLKEYSAVMLVTTVFVIVSSFIKTRTISAISCMILIMALLLGGTYVKQKLGEPELIEGPVVFYDEDDIINIEELDKEPNPYYVPKGTERDVYNFLLRTGVGAQLIDVGDSDEVEWQWYAFFNPAMTLAFTLVGAFLYRKKEID